MATHAGVTQYLSFSIADEIYAVEISRVKEVLDYLPPTKVPHTPDYMKGIINLRGSVVPVIDMRRKLGLGESARTLDTCIIIAEAYVDGAASVLGAVADSVYEVFDMEQDDHEDMPRLGKNIKVDVIKGIGKRDERFVLILDIDLLLSAGEMSSLAAIASGAGDTIDVRRTGFELEGLTE